jgi:hypothetical protein
MNSQQLGFIHDHGNLNHASRAHVMELGYSQDMHVGVLALVGNVDAHVKETEL